MEIPKMKKIYIIPVMKEIRLETASLIATSTKMTLSGDESNSVTNKSDLLGRDFDFDDEEY